MVLERRLIFKAISSRREPNASGRLPSLTPSMKRRRENATASTRAPWRVNRRPKLAPPLFPPPPSFPPLSSLRCACLPPSILPCSASPRFPLSHLHFMLRYHALAAHRSSTSPLYTSHSPHSHYHSITPIFPTPTLPLPFPPDLCRHPRGFVYLAAILTPVAQSRYAIVDPYARIAVAALKAAIRAARLRKVASTIPTEDRSTSETYRALLVTHGLAGSMSRRGNPYDNAKAESFMKTLKVEAVYLAAYSYSDSRLTFHASSMRCTI